MHMLTTQIHATVCLQKFYTSPWCAMPPSVVSSDAWAQTHTNMHITSHALIQMCRIVQLCMCMHTHMWSWFLARLPGPVGTPMCIHTHLSSGDSSLSRIHVSVSLCGGALIFHSSLLKLLDTKSTDRKLTLLHFIAMMVKEKYPELNNFWQELHFVEKAAAGRGSPYTGLIRDQDLDTM